VDVSRLAAYSLFPGQIVALECSNPSGGRLLASALFAEAPPPAPAPPPPCEDGEGRVLDLVVACGPFTTTESDSLLPLQDLLARVQEVRPHVAILLGPFVDIRNSWVENHQESYDQLFGSLLAMVEAAVEGLHTEVILVPSQRDAHSHCVYPQPPFLLGSDCSPKIRYPVRLFRSIKAPYGMLYIFGTFISKGKTYKNISRQVFGSNYFCSGSRCSDP
jgi:DNA polymerase alpha subunit B